MSDPFLIEGPAQICFSGGRTSGKMLFEILKAHGEKLPDDVKVCFENTGDECEETLEFIEEISVRWNVPVTWLEWDDKFTLSNYTKKDGTLATRRRPYAIGEGFRIVDFKTASRKGEPYDAMLDYYAKFRRTIKNEDPVLPTVPSRMCTAYLKIKTGIWYMKSLGYSDYNAIIGIRKDEPKRWATMMKQNENGSNPFINVLPLWDAGVTKPDVAEFWAVQPFDLALDLNSDEGNCRYCFLKAKHKIITIMRKEILVNAGKPTDEITRWIDREERTKMTFRRDRPDYRGLLAEALSGEEIQEVDEAIIDCICGT